jgi:hypothetical protein
MSSTSQPPQFHEHTVAQSAKASAEADGFEQAEQQQLKQELQEYRSAEAGQQSLQQSLQADRFASIPPSRTKKVTLSVSPTRGRSPVLPQQAPKDMAAKKRSMSAAMDFLSGISLNAPIKTTDHSVSNQNARSLNILSPAPSRKPQRPHDQGHEAVAVCHEDGQLLPCLSQLSVDSSVESRGARLEEELDAPHALHAALNPAQPPPPTHTKDHKDRYQVRFNGLSLLNNTPP